MKKFLTFLLTALLAFSVGWAAEVADVLTSSVTGINSSTYTAFSGKTVNSTAVYAGKCAGSNTYIQLRSNGSDCGIITTASGGTVKSITLVWASNTDNSRTLNVYGKNSAYSSAADLYNSGNQGTLLGSLNKGNGNTSLTIDGNYEYIGFCSASGALYLNSVTIVWETAGSTLPQVTTISVANGLDDNDQFEFTGSAVVTYQNGNYLWIRDGSGSGLIYGNVGNTFNNGDILDAGWTATKTSYQGVSRFTSPSNVTSTSSGSAAPEALSTFTTADAHKYVSISNVTITSGDGDNYYFTVNGTDYCLRNQWDNWPLTVGRTYNVEGVVSIYNGTAQLYLTNAEALAVPAILVNPNPLTINDSGTNNTFTVEGLYLGGDNVGLTQNGSYFTPTLSATTGWATDGGSYWYFTPNNGSLNGTVAMNYSGRELSASETVTLANNVASATVTVNYRADLYIVGDFGSGWDFSTGTPMTYNNGTYTATLTVDVGDLILFARKLGESNPWNTRYVFGPNSDGDWWVNSSPNPKTGTIDLNDDDPIYFNCAGTYTIEINASTGVLTVTREVENTGDFVLVTDASQLNAGDEVIFVNRGTQGDGLAMSTTQNSNNRGTTAVTVTATNKVTATETTQIATLEGNSSGWYFNVGDGSSNAYLYAASSSSNYLRTQSTKNDNAKAVIDILNSGNNVNVADIVFQGTNTRNVMQFNGSIVACYGSASQEDVYLYRRAGSTEPSITVDPTSLDLVIPADGSSVNGTVTVTETNTTGTTSVSITGDGANYFSATLENGTLTVTYNGTASQANPDEATITLTNGTATATVTVTGYKRVQASGTLYTKVTRADQIQDGLQYILVYETTPEALNGITSGGTGATVTWETQGSVVNISNTDVIEFTLNVNASGFTLSSDHGYLNPATAPNLTFGTSGETWSAESNDGGYVISTGGYMLRYNTGVSAANGRFRIYNNGTGRPVYLYVQGESAGVATPVITPASGAYPEDQEVTITCGTAGATIYYTKNGGETQTYSEPFTVELDEENTEATIVAWAVKDDLTSEQVTVTYTYKSDHVNNIAEFLALGEGEEVYFSNPVIVLFDYSQNSGSGQEYIWVKDRTGYTQFFIAPQFDDVSLGGADEFVPKYENGDVIPAGFKVKKNYFETGEYYQGQCYEWHSTFQDATEKALADPEQVTLSELIANGEDYNNRYLFINKLKVTGFIDDYGTYGKWEFYVAADENDDNVAEVSDAAIVGYNKYNSPEWKNKQGQKIGVPVPTDGEYYNVKFIFQKYGSKYELMPIEFTPWVDNSLRLEDLVEIGVPGEDYKISNPLIAAKVTWDADQNKFAIFAKDDEMYANKRYPADGQNEYLIEFATDGFTNTVEQRDYDQSNWIEILIPSEISSKGNPNYLTELATLQGLYENKIIKAGTIEGTFIDKLNPTIVVPVAPDAETTSVYTPNIYCTANFVSENLDADGATSYRDDEFGGQFFMMDAKPQEFCMAVWAYFEGTDNYFVIPAQQGNAINAHNFNGSFLADMSLCEDVEVTPDMEAVDCFQSSANAEVVYGFNAIVRKNPNSSAWTTPSNGAPRRAVEPKDGVRESDPAYIVYPINAGATSTGTVTAVKEINVNKQVVSVRYYNIMGMESETPFSGINIVVTRYNDGTRSTAKILK